MCSKEQEVEIEDKVSSSNDWMIALSQTTKAIEMLNHQIKATTKIRQIMSESMMIRD